MSFTIICDPGVDDAMALAFLVASGMPPSQVVAVAGNAPLEVTTHVAAGIAQLLGISAQVRTGVRSASDDRASESPFFGSDGFVGLADELPKSDVQPDSVDPSSFAGRLLVTAPLTTARVALDLGVAVEQLLWMGGLLPQCDGTTKPPEFNARLDPASTDRVLRSGQNVWMVPFDVTRQVRLDSHDLTLLARASSVGRILARACARLGDRDGRVCPHDAVAALALVDPTLFEWRMTPLACAPDGTIVTYAPSVSSLLDASASAVMLATQVDADRARHRIVDALTAPLPARNR